MMVLVNSIASAMTQGVFKKGSRRREEADFGAKNDSAFATRQSAASARRRSASLPRRLRVERLV